MATEEAKAATRARMATEETKAATRARRDTKEAKAATRHRVRALRANVNIKPKDGLQNKKVLQGQFQV